MGRDIPDQRDILIGWKAIADFFGYEVNELDAFKKRVHRAGIAFPRMKGIANVYAFADILEALKPILRSDTRKGA